MAVSCDILFETTRPKFAYTPDLAGRSRSLLAIEARRKGRPPFASLFNRILHRLALWIEDVVEGDGEEGGAGEMVAVMRANLSDPVVEELPSGFTERHTLPPDYNVTDLLFRLAMEETLRGGPPADPSLHRARGCLWQCADLAAVAQR